MFSKYAWIPVAVLVLAWSGAAIAQDAPGKKKGVFAGEVTVKGDKSFTVKSEKDVTMNFQPRWIGGKDGGGPDKEMQAKIQKLTLGQRVRVEYVVDDYPRALAITLLSPRKEPTSRPATRPASEPASEPAAETATQPAASKGTVMYGTVVDKEANWVRIKDTKGENRRYAPRSAGADGLDKDMIEKIAALKAGDKVRIEWVYEERPRLVAMEVVEGDLAELQAAADEAAKHPDQPQSQPADGDTPATDPAKPDKVDTPADTPKDQPKDKPKYAPKDTSKYPPSKKPYSTKDSYKGRPTKNMPQFTRTN